MPFTLSHPAAVLPFRAWPSRYINFAALVIGSMTPDLSYYVHGWHLAGFAHTLAGSVVICIPSGLLLLLFLHWLRRRICFILPQPHRDALLTLCGRSKNIDAVAVGVTLLCLLIGAWTHIFWDSFTHPTGWFVTHIRWLNRTALQVGSATLPVYYILQQLSSLAGAGILSIAYVRWLRRQHREARKGPDSDRWRYLLGLAITAASLIGSLPLATQAASRFHGYLAVRVFLFNAGVYAVTTAACLVVVSAIIAHFVMTRSNPQKILD